MTNTWLPNTFSGFTGKLAFPSAASLSAASVSNRGILTLPDDVFEQAQTVIQALKEFNSRRQRYFRQGNQVVRRVTDSAAGTTTLEALSKSVVLGAELSRWFRFRTTRKELAGPPDQLLNFLLNVGMDFWGLPSIQGVVTMPFFSAEGELIQHNGYHEAEQVWLDAAHLVIRPVSAAPSTLEVTEAKLLLDELFRDCLFVDEHSRNNAFAALLTPHMRRMIHQHIPMHLISADAPGAGKTTLARIITELAQDGPFITIPETTQDDEFRKRILSVLRTNPRVVVMDNINHRLDSSVLANLITSEAFSDRALGGNVMEAHLNRLQWLLTANRPEISGELRRRTSLIRLTVESGAPQNRIYQRPDLPSWLRSHRQDLLWAIFTLIQHWVAAGRPKGEVLEYGMRAYSELVGGVLECAGYGSVLANMNQLHDQASREEEDFSTLVALWHGAHGTARVTATDLAKIMREHDLYPDGLGSHKPAAIGKKLKYWEGMTAQGFVIRRPYDPANKRRLMQLQPIATPTQTGATGDTGGTGKESGMLGEDVANEVCVATGTFPPVTPVGLQA